MNESLVRLRESLLRFWNQYSQKQRIFFIAAFILSVATIAILVAQFSKTEYSVAFTNLNPSDAANVKAYLESAGVPYKLSTDGRTIGVPSTEVASVKIDVASQGLVTNGSIGYEIFTENMNSWSMTDNQFDVINDSARAGEIQKLINQISGVSSSQVLINKPKESVFLPADGAEQQASASVVVQFAPGLPPDQAKIDTIYNLVAKSVQGLNLDNITISDQNGELLPSSKLGGGTGALSGVIEKQLQVKKQFELDLQRNITSFLAPLVGRDNVVVSVFSTLNFDKKTSQENLVKPVNEEDGLGIPISSQEKQDTVTSEGGTAGGTPGTGESDIPGYPATSANQGNYESESIERVTNYEVNRITNQIESSPYVVKDLTISVGLGANASQETVQQVETLLANIVGTSLANNGQQLTQEELLSRVSVISGSFQAAADTAQSGPMNQALLYGLLGAGVVALLAGGGFVVMRRKKAKEEEIARIEAELEAAQKVEPVIDIETVNNESQIRKQLESLAKRKPEEFVNLLRTWIVDE
ncbi:flagellar basal-body MS-ring/collar protein FliF [Paenibacillus thermotolerans]|uniref:flagellar basal-body MS-ring/collar protein FliF n=1 Tax=Paenibacillus thermotolerans TaxID=3027807 RepID=UPI00236896F2|nr:MULTISPECIES: flagellar basal-body MS-ring/collar protein FliF [unclassified Paenibacillus]